MNTQFNGIIVEENGIRSISGGGTNASTATGALANLGGYPADNPSGFITGIENLVYTTGDQIISGIKTFTDELYIKSLGGQIAVLHVESGKVGINNENPQAILDVSGSALFSERPTVNGTGILLSGDINTSNFYTNNNPSGFITGIENLVYTTGSQVISGVKTFANELNILVNPGEVSTLYVSSGLIGINTESPSGALDVSGSVFFNQRPTVNGTGVLLSGEINTSNFYTNNNPSGFITGIKNLVYTTGDQNISGVKNFIQRPTVNGTGILLEGEVQNNTIISGILYSAQVNIKNNHTGTLYKGQPVYINGAAGGNILVGLASNTGEASSSKTLGLIYQDSLAVNAFGTVITDGLLSNFNVGSAAAGDPIWLGPTGNLIYGLANKPVAPNHLVYLGVVTRTNNNGEVFVKVQNGYELDELHDVAVKNSPTGQFLFKNMENQWSGKYLQISDVSNLESSLNQKQITGDYYLNSNPNGFINHKVINFYHSSSSAISGSLLYFSNLQLSPSVDRSNRAITMMERVTAKKAAWSAYCTTTGTPANLDYTGYFINNTQNTTGIINSSIKVSSAGTLFNYTGNITPEISINAGDLVSIGIGAPSGTTAPSGFQNSVDIYFYK